MDGMIGRCVKLPFPCLELHVVCSLLTYMVIYVNLGNNVKSLKFLPAKYNMPPNRFNLNVKRFDTSYCGYGDTGFGLTRDDIRSTVNKIAEACSKTRPFNKQ